MLIAQLSDIHLRPTGRQYKDVVDSNRMFVDAIDHLHALDRRPDLVIITGDLVDEGTPEEYETVVRLLARLRIPVVVMPGNHDHRETFRQTFADHRYLPSHGPMHFCIDEHPVRLIALDSCVVGAHHGRLDGEGLDWLASTLACAPARPTIVALHHPPFVCGIGYLDQYRCEDVDALAAVIEAAPQVEAVLCGHVHRAMTRRWAGTMVCACPSTTTEIALQFAEDANPQSFIGPPACLLHLWVPGQGLVTHVSYIGRYPGPYPFF